MDVLFKKLHPLAEVPVKGTPVASGFDLKVLDIVSPKKLADPYHDDFKSITLFPEERVLIRTGIALGLPEHYNVSKLAFGGKSIVMYDTDIGVEAQVRPRSGLSLKGGVYVAFGTIDNDFTGDIGIIFTNTSGSMFEIRRGDRIAQLVFAPVILNVNFHEVDDLDATDRNGLGFGSTGVRI